MKKIILGILGVFLCANVMAQVQVYERTNNQNVSNSKSASSDISMYRIMLAAVREMSPGEYEKLTFNNFSDVNGCVYLQANGQLSEAADQILKRFGGDANKSGTSQVIAKTESVLAYRLVNFLAMAEITKNSFPVIQARKMNADQAEKYLAGQFKQNMSKKFDEIAPSVQSLPRALYFEAEGQPLGNGAGQMCWSGVGPTLPQLKVVYGQLTKWRMIQGPYNLGFDGASFAVSKNGYPYIADGSILGSNLTIGSGSSAESSSARSQKKNQVGN